MFRTDRAWSFPRALYNLPSLKSALFFLHLPKKKKDAQVAKKRFAFEEIFFIQLVKGLEKEAYQRSGAFVIKPTKEIQKKFLSLLMEVLKDTKE